MAKRTIVYVVLYLLIGIISACQGKSNKTFPLSTGKSITSYSFANPPATGTINQSAGTISVTVPYGTDLTHLVATFETAGISVKVGSTKQVSGRTPNDFTNPVSYVVTAGDGSTDVYTVTVVTRSISSKAITSFYFSDLAATGIIIESSKTISVFVPNGTDTTALVATFTTSGISVMVDNTPQVSGETGNNFTNPVSYVVTAEDGSTATYTITVKTGNYVYLQSDLGDPVGNGQAYIYTQADALITLTATDGLLTISIDGYQWWDGDFKEPNNVTQLQPGYYDNLSRYPFNDPATGGMDWSGDGVGCGNITGWFAIDNITYDNNGALTAIDLRFEQYCGGDTAALHGRIHWRADDPTVPAGPINPPPAGLWQPAAGSTPANGNFIYLQSDPGDYIGAGQTYTYTQANAEISVTGTGRYLSTFINGDQYWFGDFQAMSSLTQLQPGYYGNLLGINPVRGSLDWSGEGASCGNDTGWFVIDNVTYDNNGILTAIDLRFEQHCSGAAAALHGQIHWTSNDTTIPPGPVNPPPAGLWQPAPGSTPSSGNYVYLQSDPGDFLGAGQTYTYTQADAEIIATAKDDPVATGSLFTIWIQGDQQWGGNFQTMYTLTRLQPGYYGSLLRYPFSNPARGGLDWYGEGHDCNTLTGWFMIDDVTYDNNGVLTAIDLRFEQYCEGDPAALHGQIHWRSDDPTTPPGPINPPPAGLWQPAPGSTPSGINYVYLKSDSGDTIGAGQTYTYTQADSRLTVTSTGDLLSIDVDGDQSWGGNFLAMITLTQLQPGYYGNLLRYPFNNPVRGGLDWSGNGRGCNTLTGWFVIDNITYDNNGALTAIDLRFEQHCDGDPAALHGQIHWTPDDPTTPPGPINPPPDGLWQPIPGATPASGNYVYLQSDPGDYIGAGLTYTYTQDEPGLTVTATNNLLRVDIDGSPWWTGFFRTIYTMTQLQPGYYGDLLREINGNPARGGLDWSGDGRGCNTLAGWFAIDNVVYNNGNLAAIDLRFEQHCEDATPALHGQIHWAQ